MELTETIKLLMYIKSISRQGQLRKEILYIEEKKNQI